MTAHCTEAYLRYLAAEQPPALHREPIPHAAGPICERCWLAHGIVTAVAGRVFGGSYRCGHGSAQ